MSLTKVSFSMINGAVVNVLDYGAKGDNSTNDAPAIQAAIDSAGTGATVYIPNGKYKVKTPINVPIYKRIVGQNILDTQIIADAPMDAVIKFGNTSGSDPIKLNSIENLAVYGANKVDTGIVFNTQLSSIYNVYVEGTNYAAIHASRAWSNVFQNVICSYNNLHGFYLDVECNNFDLIACESANNNGIGVIIEESLVVNLIGCGIEGNGKDGVLIQGVRDANKYLPPYVQTPMAVVAIQECYFESNGALADGANIADIRTRRGINANDSVLNVTVRDCNFNGRDATNFWILYLDENSSNFTWENNRANAFYTPTANKAYIGYQGDRAIPSYINFKNHGLAGFVKSNAFASKFSSTSYNTNGNIKFNGVTLGKQDNQWIEEGDFEYDSSTQRLNITNAAGTYPVQYNVVGTTAQRPSASLGQRYYDTTLGKPIWWNGTAWKDASGTTV